MKSILLIILFSLALTTSRAAEKTGVLRNETMLWRWHMAGRKLQPDRVETKLSGASLDLHGECFQIVLGDGSILKASDFELIGIPRTEKLIAESDSPRRARHSSGKQFLALFQSTNDHLFVEWRVLLRQDSSYLREELT